MHSAPEFQTAPAGREALLVFANELALDLHQRRLPAAAAELLRVRPLEDTAALGGCEVHWFERGPVHRADGCRHEQHGGDFGERLVNAVDELRAAGYTRIVVIGRDCPALTAADVACAFERLRRGDAAVLGPALDGGCYLIGLQAGQADFLRGIPWRRGADLAELRRRLGARPCTLLEPKSDLDTLLDLRRLAHSAEQVAALARRILALLAARTAQACNTLGTFLCEALAAARERHQLPPPRVA